MPMKKKKEDFQVRELGVPFFLFLVFGFDIGGTEYIRRREGQAKNSFQTKGFVYVFKSGHTTNDQWLLYKIMYSIFYSFDYYIKKAR